MECDRRSFLGLGAGAVSTALLGEAPARGAAPVTPGLHRWCPRFPLPRVIWQVPFAADVEEGMLLETAAGLAARAALHGQWRALIYEEVDNTGYRRWFSEYCKAHKPIVLRLTLDEVVRRLNRAAIANGYVLYRFEQSDRPLHSRGPLDVSANVATSVARWRGGVAVSERLVERVERLGLRRIDDVRERTEQWCLAESGHPFSRSLLGTADPKTRNARSLMVALGAFVCCARGEVYKRALARCEPDSPVVGWGCEGEDTQTIPSTRAGLFQTATNWCHNLPVFASEAPGAGMATREFRQKRIVHWSDLDWGDGKHHASLVLSDGDNVQWLMGNFTGGPESPSYYAHPDRGRIPFVWGLPAPSLAQLSPRTLTEVLRKATRNDDFVFFSGGGYVYPDLYGADRGGQEALRRHADRLRGYMDLTGIRILAFNFQKWDSAQALAACQVFASRIPGLLGILAFQYYPYSAGEGAIKWAPGVGGDEVPIVSCRLCVWAQTGRPRDTTPAGVAAWLNRMPVASGSATDDCFTWALVHAWSRFKKVGPGEPVDAEERGVSQERDAPGTERGYGPATWTAGHLSHSVELASAQELLHRIRYRLRPRIAFSAYLREVEEGARASGRHARHAAALAQARALLPRVGNDPGASRRCFEALARVARALRAPRA